MIKFRLASKEDASVYAHILNKSWKDTYGEYISIEHIDYEFNIEKLIDTFMDYINDDSFELYMIEYNNQIVGILELGAPDLEDIYKEDMSGFGEFRTLHIKSEYHNLGIGKVAEAFVCNRLLELGYLKSFLWVKKQNQKAILFHEKNGYVKTCYTCDNPADGAPSFVMEKNLRSDL